RRPRRSSPCEAPGKVSGRRPRATRARRAARPRTGPLVLLFRAPGARPPPPSRRHFCRELHRATTGVTAPAVSFAATRHRLEMPPDGTAASTRDADPPGSIDPELL